MRSVFGSVARPGIMTLLRSRTGRAMSTVAASTLCALKYAESEG